MSTYTTLGLYMTPQLNEQLQEWSYDSAGVVDIQNYFEEPKSTVPPGDPLAEAFEPIFNQIIDKFASLYKSTVFPVDCQPDDYHIVMVAVPKDTVYAFKDRVEAVKLLEKTDVREVHTAILQEAFNTGMFTV